VNKYFAGMEKIIICILIIFGGAALVTVGNIEYTKAIASEDAQEKALLAKSILEEELLFNFKQVKKLETIPSNTMPSNPPFVTAAWKTMANANVLIGMPKEELLNYIYIYYLLGHYNMQLESALEIQNGVANAMTNSVHIKLQILKDCSGTLNNIKAAILALKLSKVEEYLESVKITTKITPSKPVAKNEVKTLTSRPQPKPDKAVTRPANILKVKTTQKSDK
jgi:hypothetical protein